MVQRLAPLEAIDFFALAPRPGKVALPIHIVLDSTIARVLVDGRRAAAQTVHDAAHAALAVGAVSIAARVPDRVVARVIW